MIGAFLIWVKFFGSGGLSKKPLASANNLWRMGRIIKRIKWCALFIFSLCF